MVNKLREAAQAALEALELSWASRESAKKSHEAMQLLRAALDDPEKGKVPTAKIATSGTTNARSQWWNAYAKYVEDSDEAAKCPDCQPIYTHPPRREWVGLTDEEREAAWKAASGGGFLRILVAFADGIEQLLKEKNK